MKAFSGAGIDEAESTNPIEETKPDYILPTFEEDMSPRAKELMHNAKAPFERALRENSLSSDLSSADRQFFSLGKKVTEICDSLCLFPNESDYWST